MADQRDLRVGAHDETAWGAAHVKAFEKLLPGSHCRLEPLEEA
jgi:hypothetical protein